MTRHIILNVRYFKILGTFWYDSKRTRAPFYESLERHQSKLWAQRDNIPSRAPVESEAELDYEVALFSNIASFCFRFLHPRDPEWECQKLACVSVCAPRVCVTLCA